MNAQSDALKPVASPLVDPFGRKIDYLRISVTDRCNFRCVYCMGKDAKFLPKKDLLSLAEMDRLCQAFISRGVRKLRLTGGEPLMRKNVLSLVQSLSRHLDSGALDEIAMTTNGSLLAPFARDLHAAGIRRINISLDTLDPDSFASITRRGDFKSAMQGVEEAQKAGIAIKLNMVAMRGINDHEIEDMMRFAHERSMDLTFIETMPLGALGDGMRDYFIPLSEVRSRLSEKYTLIDAALRTNGPTRYVHVQETGQKLGFVTPLSHHFCGSCNRVRVTCTGRLVLCLGQNISVDLRQPIRAEEDDALLMQTIDKAISQKPAGHHFSIDPTRSLSSNRTMNVTGG